MAKCYYAALPNEALHTVSPGGRALPQLHLPLLLSNPRSPSDSIACKVRAVDARLRPKYIVWSPRPAEHNHLRPCRRQPVCSCPCEIVPSEHDWDISKLCPAYRCLAVSVVAASILPGDA